MIVVGIDTDAKGSVAILDCRNAARPSLDVYAIPNREKQLKSGKKRREVDYPALAALMLELTSRVPVGRFYLEDQWSRPKQDAGATFTFGKTFGDCRMSVAAALLASGVKLASVEDKMHFVSGADWKSDMRLSEDKDLSLKMASKLFPEVKHAWKLKSYHTSAAEASLLALWGLTRERFRLTPGVVVRPPVLPILGTADSLACL